MNNPYFHIDVGSTTPTLDAVLIDSAGQVVNLVGASVTFSLYDLGGALRFTRSGVVVGPNQGHVRFAWQPGDLAVVARYLGKFTVTYSNFDVQVFPERQYIEVFVE